MRAPSGGFNADHKSGIRNEHHDADESAKEAGVDRRPKIREYKAGYDYSGATGSGRGVSRVEKDKPSRRQKSPVT